MLEYSNKILDECPTN